MDDQQYLRVVADVCGEKLRYGARTAREVAKRLRDEGTEVSAYRCPFSHPEHHWHVGHTPSMESLKEIAAAIRYQQQEL